jgi:exopolyphosphatase/guanosine-5'-triphosphate,3'-diphosphate pyrophosphatase
LDPTPPHDPLPEGSLLAALDLGSNSFHLLIAKIEHGELRPVEALAEKVQLGAGLQNRVLSEDAIERGLACLTRFAELLESVDVQRIRVVGTNALRIAKNRWDFTGRARQILGTGVDVIYGVEEARLVYLGVAHALADDAQSRLVIDIGGGSTEFIIGERFEPRRMESLQIGCVSYNAEFFPDDVISRLHYRRAYNRARIESSHIRHNYHSDHWAESIGSSGTLQTIQTILALQGWSEEGITRSGLKNLENALLEFDTMEDIEFEGLGANRRGTILSGVAIASALFDTLNIQNMRTSKGALREGVLYDLLGRLTHEDVRERTSNALIQRYGVDADTAALVERRARVLFTATRKSWQLGNSEWDLLRWSARTHEIGMAISHKHYNRHSAYLLRNADLPGFSQQEQEQLAVLALAHRGKFDAGVFADIPELERPRLLRLICLLRLATRFKYVETLEQMPEFTIAASEQSITLGFPEDWLEQHPLTASELAQEQKVLAKMEMNLKVS